MSAGVAEMIAEARPAAARAKLSRPLVPARESAGTGHSAGEGCAARSGGSVVAIAVRASTSS
jgi:hypothetical protein